MQRTHANGNFISALAPGNGNDATPCAPQRVVLTKQASIELTWPARARGMCPWVEDIRARSRLKAARREGREETVRLEPHPAAFVERHRARETHRRPMPARGEAHLREPARPLGTHTVLSRLQTHWDGRTGCGGRPAGALDPQTAERRRRHPVGGRTPSDGSGSGWRAHLAARLGRGRHTVVLWGLPPQHWVTAFVHAWAEHGGPSPTDLSAFLPWQRAPARREARATWTGDVAPLRWSLPRAGGTGSGRPLRKLDPSRHAIHTRTDGPWRDPDAAKGGRAAFACPTGSAPASRVAGASSPITPNAMMPRCAAADSVGWVRRIFTNAHAHHAPIDHADRDSERPGLPHPGSATLRDINLAPIACIRARTRDKPDTAALRSLAWIMRCCGRVVHGWTPHQHRIVQAHLPGLSCPAATPAMIHVAAPGDGWAPMAALPPRPAP